VIIKKRIVLTKEILILSSFKKWKVESFIIIPSEDENVFTYLYPLIKVKPINKYSNE